jgi:hypothetical protein
MRFFMALFIVLSGEWKKCVLVDFRPGRDGKV